jgi:exodeoxyribonuclease V alpha subunit
MTDARRVLAATGLLREFNEAGVLAPADVHVARRIAQLVGEDDEAVLLAAALAVRGPRLGHVCVDLNTIRDTATVDVEEPVDLSALAWPEDWVARVRSSPLVGGPLQLEGSVLYLDRYWREERQVADDLRALMEAAPVAADDGRLAEGLARMGGDGRQRLAAETAVKRRFAVVAGGPGTGKTTTVAHILALLYEQGGDPLVALAAPTGKAAARLVEAVHEEARRLSIDEQVRERLLALDAFTLHRLLGWRPDSHSRFRHNRGNRLPYDVVIVDETSMVSLSLMARLIEAVRPDARLILVGDPGQLTSIEAGAVLGDIVGPTGPIVVLERVHRFGGAIANVAEAIRKGDGDAVIDALGGVTWVDDPEILRDRVVTTSAAVLDAAKAGDGARAIEALGAFRVLCAHRRGPYGVATWTARIEDWIGNEAGGEWYVGRPLLVTENDYGLRLYNGDTGVVVASGAGRVSAAFERHGDVVEFSPTRLAAVDTVYAMTVHKSQGSQFDTAAVLLPEPTSPILTRELLYTAVTRAREELILVGSEESVRAAVERPVARASGLRDRLWGLSGQEHGGV